MDRLVFRLRRAMGRKIVRRAIAGDQLRADTRVDLVLLLTGYGRRLRGYAPIARRRR